MPQTVEISLRIPSLRVRNEETDTLETINNSDIRFSKQIEVESIPKPGVVLTMAISSGETFQCDVVRSDWHHTKTCSSSPAGIPSDPCRRPNTMPS